MPILVAFIVGTLFAAGLGISGMTQPDRVIGFLDFFGRWDGSLMFVMGGAVITNLFFYRVVRGHAPVLGAAFRIPTSKQISPRLIIGSGMFGIGWGMAGFCPGPALVSLSNGATDVLIFVGAMVGGMYLFKLVEPLLLRTRAAQVSTGGEVALSPAPEPAAR